MSAKISEFKKPELKTGGTSMPSSIDAVMVEKVDNGWVLRLISSSEEEAESVMVYPNDRRDELLKEMAKHI